MQDEPRLSKRVPGSLKALLALILVLVVLGLLLGFVLAAIGPSQDPNVGGALPPKVSDDYAPPRPLA